MLASSEQQLIHNEGLSAVIVETIKSPSKKYRISAVPFLSETPDRRDGVPKMLTITRPEVAGREATVQKTESGKNCPIEKNHPAETSGQESVLRAAVEEREQSLRMTAFMRRSMTTMIALASQNGGEGLAEPLDAFRRVVQEDGRVEEMEKSLETLRAAIKLPVYDESTRSRIGSSPGLSDDREVKKLKSMFLNIVEEFDQDLGEDYSDQFSKLRKAILTAEEPGNLTALQGDLLTFIQMYHRALNEERNQITDFISEIESSLMEVERQFLSWITESEQSSLNDTTSFNTIIEGHVEDMKKSAQLSTTLAEFRNVVILRLASIREALEQKRKAEELREETVNVQMENLQQNIQKMKKEIDQVQEKRKALEKEILIDQLTGIANRRAGKQRLKEEMQRYLRYRQNFSVLLFDIDHFKSVNDRFGHWAGDKCLKEIIKRIKPMLREADFLARWGGEEFVIVFPGTAIDNAVSVAERLRRAIENTRLLYHKQEIAVTVSIGVAEVSQEDQSLEMIFSRADKAMYEAKKTGRNKVVRA